MCGFSRSLGLKEGFKAVIRTNEGWMYTETIEDAEQFAIDNSIERPKVFDLKTGKRVLV